jgi:hypothetical protein
VCKDDGDKGNNSLTDATLQEQKQDTTGKAANRK